MVSNDGDYNIEEIIDKAVYQAGEIHPDETCVVVKYEHPYHNPEKLNEEVLTRFTIDYYWKDGKGKPKINLSDHKWGRVSQGINQSRRVVQFSLKGKKLQLFNSIKEAASEMKVHPTSITDVCKGRSKTCGGYKWKYKD